jgi:hypothetical protein
LPLLAAGLLLAATATPAASVEPGESPNLVGMATLDRTDFDTLGAVIGHPTSMWQVFWTLEQEWPNTWAARWLDDLHGRGMVAYAELTTDDFAGFLAGEKDQTLQAMASTLAEWLNGGTGRHLIMAPFPEANLVDFNWGADPAGYKTAYLKVRQAFLDAGAGPDKVRFVFAMHSTSSTGFSMADFYPGDDAVDLTGFSIINRNNPWHDYDSAFQRFLDEIKGTITQAKPILITQTASLIDAGDRDAWIRDMFRNLGADEQVIGALWFNRALTESGVWHDFRVVNGSWVDPVFAQEASAWSPTTDVEWIFDGRMDTWVAAREDLYAGVPYLKDILGSAFEQDIMWLAKEKITAGCNPPANDRFCPDAGVTRGQMAAFLVRALGLPAWAGADRFVDDDASEFEADVEALAAAGITVGCNPPANDRFCPDAGVTRGQMAAFLHRALGDG